MHRFFAEILSPDRARLFPEEENHALRVLRMQPGDPCQALSDGRVFAAHILEISPRVILSLEEELPSPEPAVRVTLYQGIPKGDKMDYIVQKCTEAGIGRIVPVSFSRCVAKWEQKDGEKKRLRLQRIAAEAAKQSGRALTPEISFPLTLTEVCRALPGHALCLVPWEEQRQGGIGANLNGEKDIALIIGPEGGIDPREIEALTAAGAKPVTLGKRIFRTETAGLAALISLLTLTGDME